MVADMCIRGGANASRLVIESEGYPWPIRRLHRIGFFRAAVKLGCMFPEHGFQRSTFREILRMMISDPCRLRRYRYDLHGYDSYESRHVIALVNYFDNAGELLYNPTCMTCRTIHNRFEIKLCKCKTAYYCSESAKRQTGARTNAIVKMHVSGF